MADEQKVIVDDFSGMLAGPSRIAYRFKLAGEPYDVPTIDLDELAAYGSLLGKMAALELDKQSDPLAGLEGIRAAKGSIILFIRGQLKPEDRDRFAVVVTDEATEDRRIVGGEVVDCRVEVAILFQIASKMAEAATGRPFPTSVRSSPTPKKIGGASRGRTSSTAAARKRSAPR